MEFNFNENYSALCDGKLLEFKVKRKNKTCYSIIFKDENDTTKLYQDSEGYFILHKYYLKKNAERKYLKILNKDEIEIYNIKKQCLLNDKKQEELKKAMDIILSKINKLEKYREKFDNEKVKLFQENMSNVGKLMAYDLDIVKSINVILDEEDDDGEW